VDIEMLLTRTVKKFPTTEKLNLSHCNNIRDFSQAVYNHLTEVFKYRLSFSEIGLTDHLMLEMARFSRFSGLSNIEIYKMPWTIESAFGNDIDLFIQNKSGTFNWYALQAKVMSYNGAFKDLKFKKGATTQQWDKLLSHEKAYGSKTYYLLYSGQPLNLPTSAPKRKDCLGIPTIYELGLGIVETKVISSIRTTTLKPTQFFYFNHVFPNHIDSIRKLLCCPSDLPETLRTYQRSDIETGRYQRIGITDNAETNDINEKELEPLITEDGNAPIRLIIKSEQSAKGK
jgi:hypothetical protein